MMQFAKKRAEQLMSDQRGSVLIELAFAIPMMMLLIFGGVEVARFLMTAQKVNRVAMTTADLVSQAREIAEGDINNMFVATKAVMGDESIDTNGAVIISSVTRTGDDAPVVKWQRRSAGGHSGASGIGSEGGTASLPSEIVLDAGDGVIIAEVFYKHAPLLFNKIVGERDIYQISFYRPRFGALESVEP